MLVGLAREVLGAERSLSDQQLVCDDRQRVAVAGRARGLAERLLRRQVRGRAEQLSGDRDRVLGRDPGDPKVRDVQASLAVKQEIPRLDVPMDNPLLMRIVERRGGLPQPAEGQLGLEFADAQGVRDRAAGKVLHHDERPPAGCVARRHRLADVEDRDHVGVA